MSARTERRERRRRDARTEVVLAKLDVLCEQFCEVAAEFRASLPPKDDDDEGTHGAD